MGFKEWIWHWNGVTLHIVRLFKKSTTFPLGKEVLRHRTAAAIIINFIEFSKQGY